MFFLPIHQYSQLSLAEMYASSLIILALMVYNFQYVINRNKAIFYLYLILLVAVLFKLQFIYVLVIPVIISFIDYVAIRSDETRKRFALAVIYLFTILILFLVVWYLPFKKEWEQVAINQSGGFSIKKLSIFLVIIQFAKHSDETWVYLDPNDGAEKYSSEVEFCNLLLNSTL